ncbi:MAG: carboxylating nicotinate-nucleotide diphosphorylase [Kordiimonadaceae bacterium]|jgi:nicotinate-nucleotide pyrophosphorylase (carboxylating)|nr:carboxylating nicotinate-nucleotide diphosphorylase [Kordiimonadaceae bacterium]MBT6035959.1 carboxylating nicotinate-nucleotide diphosphorylase [Kordiimonadaceae bacterium]MBT6330665.1 carboxylating nicotinate-nucleotide diphosphorylase [Kordiimonadaceae bacterium]MBT7582866.1 carboxylating nicotinate-nucleotide diphosphorylase [Kordiimonadaceae bacterium]
MPLFKEELRSFITSILEEDIGAGDFTTLATIAADATLKAEMNAREGMVIAGIDIAERIIHTVDPAIKVEILVQDGVEVTAGNVIMRLDGNARNILTAERAALNTLQHLSGIATLSRAYVREIEHTNCRLLDTRKTIPMMRKLAKYATKMGGAMNHRMRLDDGILIKDNHIASVGSISAAVGAAKNYGIETSTIGITVECDTLEQAAEAVAAGADRLLLDNMSLEMLRGAVANYSGQVKLEASGGVTLGTIKAIAETGVDFISVGRITQSAPAVDIGLDYLN